MEFDPYRTWNAMVQYSNILQEWTLLQDIGDLWTTCCSESFEPCLAKGNVTTIRPVVIPKVEVEMECTE